MISCSCSGLCPWSWCRHRWFGWESGWKRAKPVFWKIRCRSRAPSRSTSARRCWQTSRSLSGLERLYVWILIFLHVGSFVAVVEGLGKDGGLVFFFGHFVESCTLELFVDIFLFKKLIPRCFKCGHLTCGLVAVVVKGLFGTSKTVLRWGLPGLHSTINKFFVRSRDNKITQLILFHIGRIRYLSRLFCLFLSPCSVGFYPRSKFLHSILQLHLNLWLEISVETLLSYGTALEDYFFSIIWINLPFLRWKQPQRISNHRPAMF